MIRGKQIKVLALSCGMYYFCFGPKFQGTPVKGYFLVLLCEKYKTELMLRNVLCSFESFFQIREMNMLF